MSPIQLRQKSFRLGTKGGISVKLLKLQNFPALDKLIYYKICIKTYSWLA